MHFKILSQLRIIVCVYEQMDNTYEQFPDF